MSAATGVLVSGLISADISFRLDQMPRLAEKYRASDMRFSLGGGGAIAATALRRLGARVELAGRLGDDLFANLLREELRRRDIGQALVLTCAGTRSPVSSIFIDNDGERQIVNYRGADPLPLAADHASTPATGASRTNDAGLVTPEFSGAETALDEDRLASLLAPAAVLVDTRWEAAAIQALQWARHWGVPGVVDGETPVCPQAMHLATHVAFSRQGLRDYAGHEDIHAALLQAAGQFDGWVCVTDGEHGVYHLQSNELVRTPALSVQSVDSLGAGDVWHAAFTLQLARSKDEVAAIEFANVAAAMKCESDDGLDGIPEHDAVLHRLADLGGCVRVGSGGRPRA